jgi:hypothetical protein
MITLAAYAIFLISGTAVCAMAYGLGYHRDCLAPHEILSSIFAAVVFLVVWLFSTHYIVHNTGLHALVFG